MFQTQDRSFIRASTSRPRWGPMLYYRSSIVSVVPEQDTRTYEGSRGKSAARTADDANEISKRFEMTRDRLIRPLIDSSVRNESGDAGDAMSSFTRHFRRLPHYAILSFRRGEKRARVFPLYFSFRSRNRVRSNFTARITSSPLHIPAHSAKNAECRTTTTSTSVHRRFAPKHRRDGTRQDAKV